MKANTAMEQADKATKHVYIQAVELHTKEGHAQQTSQGSASWPAEPFQDIGVTVEDATWQTMTMTRFMMAARGGNTGVQDPANPPTCARTTHGHGRLCGHNLDDRGRHDAVCKLGWTSTRGTIW